MTVCQGERAGERQREGTVVVGSAQPRLTMVLHRLPRYLRPISEMGILCHDECTCRLQANDRQEERMTEIAKKLDAQVGQEKMGLIDRLAKMAAAAAKGDRPNA